MALNSIYWMYTLQKEKYIPYNTEYNVPNVFGIVVSQSIISEMSLKYKNHICKTKFYVLF